MCLGCGREFCGVGYMGSRVCGGKLRKKGWAMSGGHCTSCVCGECGAAGRACPPSCQWASGPPPPPPASQGPGLAASSNQPSPWAAAAAKAAPAWELVAWEAPAALPALPAPSANAAQPAPSANAVPHEEHGEAQTPPGPTTADLLYMIQELQRRLTAVEQELADNRYWQWRK